MRKLMGAVLLFTFSAATAHGALTVTGVSARQRWPWNNLVDVDFTVNGAAGEPYRIDLSATYDDGKRSLFAKSFVTEPIVGGGVKSRVVWDLGADYPDFRADDLQVTVTATPFSATTPVYLVIDVSGGKTASSYPIRYTTTKPVMTAGSPDACKTTEIWLRRINGGTCGQGNGAAVTGSGLQDKYAQHTVTLTEDYYIGIFPITQAQWENVGSGLQGSSAHSVFTNPDYAATRPVDSIYYKWVRDSDYDYPTVKEISQDTFLKRLRDRTGLDFDLPTEWQWEYAGRAGGSTSHRGGWSESTMRTLGAAPSDYEFHSDKSKWSAAYGTPYVDQYKANSWGIYCMLGGVREWCVNSSASITRYASYTDLKGGVSNSRRTKGSDWSRKYDYAFLYYYRNLNDTADSSNSNHPMKFKGMIGARISLTIPKPVAVEEPDAE